MKNAYTYQGDNYHHCIDCGSTIKFGDMVFRGKWGYRCYTCQYYFDKRETMSNIKITAEVDGKIVPLENISTETFEAIKALEKPKEIPVARVGHYKGCPSDRRLFLKITDSIKRRITNKNVGVIAIDLQYGDVNNEWPINNEEYNLYLYENVQSL